MVTSTPNEPKYWGTGSLMKVSQEIEKSKESHLTEMARVPMSDKADNLPFRIVVQFPDPAPTPHAHITDLETGKEEIGTFKLIGSRPRTIDKLEPYTVRDKTKHLGLINVSDDQKRLIIKWLANKSVGYSRYNNWEILQLQYKRNLSDWMM